MIGREHRYESCRDWNCERPYCRIWREARREGYDAGYAEGYEDGFAARPLLTVYVQVPSGSTS